MLPWMRPGDISRVRRTNVENVRCGDLVLFRRHNRLLVHRIVDERVKLGVRQVSAKGDAHPDSDGWLEMDELLGRVVVIYRRSRHIRLETRSQVALGRVIAQLSLWRRFWDSAARLLAARSSPPPPKTFHRAPPTPPASLSPPHSPPPCYCTCTSQT